MRVSCFASSESGRSAPHPDEVLLMEQGYGNPELSNYYCTHECQIGMKYEQAASLQELPPLTVEPLVENAIQHGVKNGGTVTLATRAGDGEISITVSDDGVGMRAAATERVKKRAGISMENVRARLAALCGGTLEIESAIGEGTTATIRLPKRQEG